METINATPLLVHAVFMHEEWHYIKVNRHKLMNEKRIREQIAQYFLRKYGQTKLRNMGIGFDGDDYVQNKATIAFRFLNPLNN